MLAGLMSRCRMRAYRASSSEGDYRRRKEGAREVSELLSTHSSVPADHTTSHHNPPTHRVAVLDRQQQLVQEPTHVRHRQTLRVVARELRGGGGRKARGQFRSWFAVWEPRGGVHAPRTSCPPLPTVCMLQARTFAKSVSMHSNTTYRSLKVSRSLQVSGRREKEHSGAGRRGAVTHACHDEPAHRAPAGSAPTALLRRRLHTSAAQARLLTAAAGCAGCAQCWGAQSAAGCAPRAGCAWRSPARQTRS
jgi:hypothetical protein